MRAVFASLKQVFVSISLLTAGCGSIEYNSTNSPRMVVAVERTPFFRNGPAQGNGPDLSLTKGDEVEVLRRELGYSFVRIYDGQNGYVANEALRSYEPAIQTVSPTISPVAPDATNASKPNFRY